VRAAAADARKPRSFLGSKVVSWTEAANGFGEGYKDALMMFTTQRMGDPVRVIRGASPALDGGTAPEADGLRSPPWASSGRSSLFRTHRKTV
jgi:hypothetical protein